MPYHATNQMHDGQISRRSTVAVALALGVALSTGCGTPSAAVGDPSGAVETGPPNIVWIVSDGLRAPFTDHVAAVADAGVSFTHFATDGAGSLSHRSALLTGVPPATLGLGADGFTTPPPAGVKVLPLELRNAGYYTSRAGPAVHNLSVRSVADAEGSPFAQPGLLGAWDAAGREADWRGRLVDWESPCTVSFGCGAVGVDRSRPFFALFNVAAGDSAAIDREIGAILATLEEDGLADETAVFIVGLDVERGFVIARRPGDRDAGTTRDDRVSIIDLAPTTLALAGVPVSAHMTGRVLFDTGAPAEPTKGQMDAAPSSGWRAPDAGSPPAAATPAGYPTGGLFHVAPRVKLSCDTEGSTIVYTTEREAPFYWRLYTGPFRMRFWTLRFQCGRLGFRNSDIVAYDFDIE